MAFTATTVTTSDPPLLTTRKYRLRSSPLSRLRSKIDIPLSPPSRGILIPLPSNLRRRPSRSTLLDTALMSPSETIRVGTKRKRVTSTNENTLIINRTFRKHKRRRGYREHDSDDSDMEVDQGEEALWMRTEVNEDDGGGDDESFSRDQYYLNIAPVNQLIRLRKEELCRLYNLNNPTSSHDPFTKQDLADAIINFRTNGSLRSSPHAAPPSSPSSMGVGEDESDIEELRPVRRLSNRCLGRSFSLSYLASKKSVRHAQQLQKTPVRRTYKNNGVVSRTHSNSTTQSRRSSPSAVSSPVVLRLRTRTVSFHLTDKDRPAVAKLKDTHATDSDQDDDPIGETIRFSPRRLRSRPSSKDQQETRRVTPMRKAKILNGSLKKTDEEEELQDELDTDDEQMAPEDQDVTLDDLAPSLVPQSYISRRTRSRAVKATRFPYDLRPSRTAPDLATPKRSSPRRRHTKVGISSAASDGDDEETDGEDHGSESEEDVEEELSTGEPIITEPELEPKRLRNGKIIGEDEGINVLSISDGEKDDVASVDLEAPSDNSTTETTSSDLSTEGEEGVEEALTDVRVDDDLQDATAKSLVRRRRDDLVKLCETRGIDVEGTKPQLVEALLQWRDSRPVYGTSPSSGATAHPPSTTRFVKDGETRTPVLMWSKRVEVSDPNTPKPASNQHTHGGDDNVLLDLEGLGLEDSVIPPSKLTKLEKIGSGGFKDVYVGKLGGKKVAVAEFRGQLTEMDIKELKLLARFAHPNVVKFLGVSIPENPKETPMIVSELCSNGDLFDYVRNVPAPSLNKVLNLMLDVARGLKYLHDHKPSVIHRDCKSSNILITSRVTAKIADFGLAKVKQSTRSMVRSLVGTVNWQAPELWHPHPKYNFKVDVFSCAMVFWEILQWNAKEKKYPWEGMNEHAIYDAVGSKQQRPPLTGLAKQWCPEIIKLMEQMWAQDPKSRPDMTHVVQQLEDLKEMYPAQRNKR
ncbi:hypothetical protein Clacol_006764 [Clathrus columnatus]|uniref:Protein kinase domain-containing protein n=1 Tax=Clathrus columnatus TaxID=1419009 RepID=A0AAV5AHU0_9AGAM|nr:hypothetical protein Clacol_006764 [Clathrus columnatus]